MVLKVVKFEADGIGRGRLYGMINTINKDRSDSTYNTRNWRSKPIRKYHSEKSKDDDVTSRLCGELFIASRGAPEQ